MSSGHTLRSSPIGCENCSTFRYSIKSMSYSTWKYSLSTSPGFCQGRGGLGPPQVWNLLFPLAIWQPSPLYNVPLPGPLSGVICLTYHSGHSGRVPRLFVRGVRGCDLASCSSHEPQEPQHCVFTAVQGCRLAGFKTSKCSPAAPTSLPGSSVWNLFFSLAIWQPSNLYRMG